MDVNDFERIGACEIGYAWRVASENKVVVNIGKVALYFEVEEFFSFGQMIDESVKNLAKKMPQHQGKVKKPSSENKIASISKFRSSKENDEE